MRFLYQHFLKPILFLIDPEDVHDVFTNFGFFLGKFNATRELTRFIFHYENKKLTQKLHKINFKNPVGLSAGFDKDANLVKILPHVGFGFTQVGTVTFKAYKGNPKPRLKRFPKDSALAVYYGLKNIGAEKIINKLSSMKLEFPVSISIGKTNAKYTSDLKSGIQDYIDGIKLFEKQKVKNDFYTINISCPNTFGGEPFTDSKSLNKLLREIDKLKIKKPIFVKMPINLSWHEFEKLLKIIVKYKLAGVIIGNLNKNKKYPKTKGGISGKPTWRLSNNLISKTYQKYGKKLTIIGVGGIFSGRDAYEKIQRGASLVQVITGMVFEGPMLISQINKDLVEYLERDGYKNISEAVGSFYKD